MKHTKLQKGFSLIELITVTAILVALLAIAIPNFIGWRSNQRFRNALIDLYGNLHMARAHATKSGTLCSVIFSQEINGETYDYVIFEDKANQLAYDNGETIIKKVKLADYKNVELESVTLADNVFGFRRNGLPKDNNGSLSGTEQINLKNTSNNEIQSVQVSIAGNISINKE